MSIWKQESETVEEKFSRLKSLRTDLQTVQLRLSELDTTAVATKTFDGDVIGAMRSQRVRDAKVSVLMHEEDRLIAEIAKLVEEIKQAAPICQVCGNRFGSEAALKKHKAEARTIQNQHQCGLLL